MVGESDWPCNPTNMTFSMSATKSQVVFSSRQAWGVLFQRLLDYGTISYGEMTKLYGRKLSSVLIGFLLHEELSPFPFSETSMASSSPSLFLFSLCSGDKQLAIWHRSGPGSWGFVHNGASSWSCWAFVHNGAHRCLHRRWGFSATHFSSRNSGMIWTETSK